MPGGQYINHFGAIRVRVTGTGNLNPKLISLDTTTELDITPIAMTSPNSRYANQLCNFMQQRAQLELKTTEIDEVFYIRQIMIYARPVYSGFPQ